MSALSPMRDLREIGPGAVICPVVNNGDFSSFRSSGPEELHLQALTEPCLKVSPYTALRGFESAPSREHPVSGGQRFLLVAQLTKAAIEPRHPLRSPSITEASTLLPDDPPSHAAFLLSISRVTLIGFRLAST